VNPLALIPVGVFAFLGGAALGRTRRGLSMTPRTSSPLPGVPLLSWERFVTVMAVSPPARVTPRRRMGMFGMDARRLADVGFMEEARKASVGGEPGVWVARWREPLTTEKFLASTPAQYEAFRRSCGRMAPRVQGLVGRVVDGQKCSLSGLLGVGHLAGESGVAGWVADPGVRKRFRATTAAFHRTNGVF
jgi:hypothetical protein